MRKIIVKHSVETEKLNLSPFVKEFIEKDLLSKLSEEANKDGLLKIKQEPNFQIDPFEKDEQIISIEANFISNEEIEKIKSLMKQIKFFLPDIKRDLYYELMNIIK